MAVLTLALGIAANAAIFSVVHGVLLRPLPYADADRIVAVWTYSTRGEDTAQSAGDYAAHPSDAAVVFASGWIADERVHRDEQRRPGDQHRRRLGDERVLRCLRDDAGRRARCSRPTADAASADAPVVISEKTWRDAFGASPAIVGQRIKIDGSLHTVLGVVPAAFKWPSEAELWLLSPRAIPPSPIPVG